MSKHNESLAKAGTTVRATVAAILTQWEAATDAQREAGAQWYPDAAIITRDMANGHTLETAAAVVAHCSPQLHWSRNVLAAALVLRTGEQLSGLMGSSYRAAHRALASDNPLATLNGPKVRRFAANILGDHDAVTVDVHATRVALPNCKRAGVIDLVGVYDAVEHCYRLAARRVNVSPATMQATTWIVQRNGRHA